MLRDLKSKILRPKTSQQNQLILAKKYKLTNDFEQNIKVLNEAYYIKFFQHKSKFHNEEQKKLEKKSISCEPANDKKVHIKFCATIPNQKFTSSIDQNKISKKNNLDLYSFNSILNQNILPKILNH